MRHHRWRSLGIIALAGCVATAWPAHAEDIVSYSTTNDTATVKAIEKALASSVEFDFDNTPLAEVISHIADKFQILVRMDNKALSEAGVALDAKINCKVKGVTLRAALRQILGDHDLTYVIRHELLLVTSKAGAETTFEVRVYPVGDLVEPRKAVMGSNNEHLLGEPDYDSLIELILASVHPTSWSTVGGTGGIEVFDRSLVISQAQEVHEDVAALLTTLRRVRKAQGVEPPVAEKKDDGALHVRVYRLISWHYSAGFGGASGPVPAAGANTSSPPADTKPEPNKVNRLSSPGDRDHLLAQVSSSVLLQRLGLEGVRSEKAATEAAEELAKVIPTLIEPASWKTGGGGGSIHAISGTLVVRQTDTIHRQVDDLVRMFKAAAP